MCAGAKRTCRLWAATPENDEWAETKNSLDDPSWLEGPRKVWAPRPDAKQRAETPAQYWRTAGVAG